MELPISLSQYLKELWSTRKGRGFHNLYGEMSQKRVLWLEEKRETSCVLFQPLSLFGADMLVLHSTSVTFRELAEASEELPVLDDGKGYQLQSWLKMETQLPLVWT